MAVASRGGGENLLTFKEYIKSLEQYKGRVNTFGLFLGDRDAFDFSRSYMFRVEIPFIELDTTGQDLHFAEDRLSALCRSTTLPAYEIATKEFEFQNFSFHLAEKPKFNGSWSCKFLLEEYHDLRNIFLIWMDQVMPREKMYPTSPETYKSNTITVTQLDKFGTEVVRYQFIGAFPQKILDVKLDHTDTNIPEFEVVFRFDQFNILTFLEPGAQDQNGILDSLPIISDIRNIVNGPGAPTSGNDGTKTTEQRQAIDKWFRTTQQVRFGGIGGLINLIQNNFLGGD